MQIPRRIGTNNMNVLHYIKLIFDIILNAYDFHRNYRLIDELCFRTCCIRNMLASSVDKLCFISHQIYHQFRFANHVRLHNNEHWQMNTRNIARVEPKYSLQKVVRCVRTEPPFIIAYTEFSSMSTIIKSASLTQYRWYKEKVMTADCIANDEA